MKIEIILALIDTKGNYFMPNFEKLSKISNEQIEINYGFEKIDFNVKKKVYFLLYCIRFQDYEEILSQYADRMILMDASYTDLGEIIGKYNFAGIICWRFFSTKYPILFGLKPVVKKVKDNRGSIPLLNSEKYDVLSKPQAEFPAAIMEYLTLYDEYIHKERNH